MALMWIKLCAIILISIIALQTIRKTYMCIYRYISRSKLSEKIQRILILFGRGTYKIVFLLVVLCCLYNVATSVLIINAESKTNKECGNIHVLDSDPQQTVEQIFAIDDLPEGKYNDFQKILHYDWMEHNLSSSLYKKKMASIYTTPSEREDESYEQLNAEEKKQIKYYANIILPLQDKRDSGEKITLEECEEERHAYWESYQLRETAEMAYQSGRAAEDLFWMNKNEKDYTLKMAAQCIEAFEEFVQFTNRMVGVNENRREVPTSEILYRNAKMYYSLASNTDIYEEKTHLLLCAYGCASNVYKNHADDEFSLMGEYYKGMAIIRLYDACLDENKLEDFDDTLYDELEHILPNIKNLLKESKQKKESKEMPDRINELCERIQYILSDME